MRIAWFRAAPPNTADPLDDAAALISALGSNHDITVVIEADAHDFVWQQAFEPYDLCVYELDNTPAHEFVWGYLLNFPGVVLLKSVEAQQGAGRAISREGRLADYMSGFEIDRLDAGAASLRVPLLASRCVVVQHRDLAESLSARYADAHIRYAPVGVHALNLEHAPSPPRPLVVGVPGHQRMDMLERAAERVRAAGGNVQLILEGSVEDVIGACDVVVALTWPPHSTSLAATLAGMAASKPVIVLEIEATADWPALDPQTWRPRGVLPSGDPIAITLSPLDEAHSLALALLRLGSDETLRIQLGRAAHAWWLAHATPAQAAAAWEGILAEARHLTPPARPTDWPSHLDTDGTELTRAILDDMGATNDLWPNTRALPPR